MERGLVQVSARSPADVHADLHLCTTRQSADRSLLGRKKRKLSRRLHRQRRELGSRNGGIPERRVAVRRGEQIEGGGHKSSVDSVLSFAARTSGPAEAAASQTSADEARWRAFFDSHWEWVCRLVRRLAWRELDVEDAVQDVFVVLIEKLASFEHRSDIKTWIYRVCLNVVSEHRRRHRRRRLLGEVAARLSPWRSGLATPADQLEVKDELTLVRSVLGRMAPKKRDVFVLCEMEELSTQEAAEILGVPDATVRTRLHYARQDFLAFFAREGVAP